MAYWTISLPGGPKRANQVAATFGCKIYSFGEYDYQDESSPGERIFGVHVLDTESYRWKQLLAASEKCLYLPAELYDEVCGKKASKNDDDDDDDDGDNNDNNNDNDDTRIKRLVLHETPSHRSGHSVVTYEGNFYMWGGCTEELFFCTKMFCFHPEKETWSVIPCDGDTPPGRTRHTAVVFDDMMIIYGGREINLEHFPQTVCAYNFETRKWYEMIAEGESPNGREFHTACVIDKKMYVFGGNDMLMNDLGLVVLNLETSCWEKPEESGDIPCNRRSHTAWVYQGMMYVFGGFQCSTRQHLNTLHEFNPETSRWRLLQQYGLGPPIRRERHCSIIVDDRVFVFGGLTSLIQFNRPTDVELLRETCDLHVLDHEWRLQDLCFISLLRNKVNDTIFGKLPPSMRSNLRMMSTPNGKF